MKKILVIGASGFVGKHLTKALLQQHFQVRCLTRNPMLVRELLPRQLLSYKEVVEQALRE